MLNERLTKLQALVPRRVVRLLPARLSVPMLARRAPARHDTADHRSVPLPAPLTLDVYWLRSPTGATGPAASVHHGIEELLRIDGLRGACHVHYDLAESRARRTGDVAARRRLDDADIPAWASDELRFNLRYALSLQRRARLRRQPLDEAALDEAARRLRREFEDLLSRHGHEGTAT